nr:MAG TPA: homing endonuclease [Caudoviricetes sp.]
MVMKKFKLNENYEFDMFGNGTYLGKEILPNKDGYYSITIGNITRPFSKQEIGLITHFEIDFDVNELEKIMFVPSKSNLLKMKCGYLMVITGPIITEMTFPGSKYRVIPGYPGFIINKYGDVISRNTGRVLSKKDSNGYQAVNIYNPDKSEWRSVPIHILLARAFIENGNPDKYCCVNHINGNKQNNSLENLEWVTYSENINHAVESGLRNDNCPALVRDINDNSVLEFPSLSRAFKHIGYSWMPSLVKNINGVFIPNLFKDRFEIKLKDDNTNWYYGYPDKSEKSIEAFNLQTKEVKNFDSMSTASKELGIRYMRLNGAINSIETLSVDGWLVRYKTDEPWPIVYRESKPSPIFRKKEFVAKNLKTNEVLEFESGRSLLRHFYPLIKRKSFESKINKNKEIYIEDWHIKLK